MNKNSKRKALEIAQKIGIFWGVAWMFYMLIIIILMVFRIY